MYQEKINNFIVIKNALESDATEIYELASKIKLQNNNDADISKRGFLKFVPDADEYAKRLKTSQNCFVARINGTLAGFITSFDHSELQHLGRENDIAVKAIKEVLESDIFIFLDQLAVDPEFNLHGIGQKLLNQLRQKNKESVIAGAIVEAPIANEASLNFSVNKNGFIRKSEIISDGVTRGIYLQYPAKIL